ncbi:MAG: diguanylate cyclase [Spirochaetes bacterium]|nr:diguanylate cyclase [Spirochaetota bacterium]
MDAFLKKNEVIGTFHILEKIGEGGMSLVYHARDKKDKKDVAIKFLKQGVTSSYIEDVIRFKREIESVSQLKHPHIVKVYHAGEHRNIPFIVMEYLKGESLSELLNKRRELGIKEGLDIICQLTDALQYVHSKGIIHRDLKPGNIIINKKGSKCQAKLLDFGVSFIMELGNIKGEEEIVGTFGYMSPEATGIINKRIDERSDLYSLGIIFYKIFTGELPFKGKEISKILHQQVAVLPQKMSKIRGGIPPELEEIVYKLLNKEPELRYQSAKGLSFDLERYRRGERAFIIGENDQKVKISYQTSLVGREAELNKIKKLFHKSKDAQGSICLIAGEPGIGKSRLVEEMRGFVYEEGGLFIGGRCLDQENKTPYQPFRDAINGYVRYIERLEKIEKKDEIKRIKKVLGELGEIILRLNGNMSQILGETPKLVSLDPDRENQRFLMVSANFFCNLGMHKRPCVLFIDDLQWADEGTLRLLEEIQDSVGDHNLFILGTFRDNEVGKDHSLNRILNKSFSLDKIKLENLSYNRLNKMVAGLLGERESKAHELSKYVIEKSAGNPFFAINIIRELVEEKGLVWKSGFWEADWGRIRKIPVSANMLDIIMKRIQDLSEEQSEILYLSSVIGREFEIELLYPLINLKKEDIVSLVDEAIQMQLIQESMERGKKIFVHDKIRDAFYQKISKKRRQDLHARVARVIEERNKKNIEPVVFDLAHHFFKAGDSHKSLQYVLPAAEKAKREYANDEAIRYYTLGIQLLEKRGQKGDPAWVKAREELAEVYLTTGNSDEAIEISKDILKYKKTPLAKAKIYRKIGRAFFKKGNWIKCEEHIKKGLLLLGEYFPMAKGKIIVSLLKELLIHLFVSFFPFIIKFRKSTVIKEDDKEIIWFYISANWMYVLSNLFKFIRASFRIMNIATLRVRESNEYGISLGGYAAFLMAIPLFKRALKYHIKALDIKKNFNDEWGIAQSLQFMGFCYQWQGLYDRSTEHFLPSIEKFQNMGDMWEYAMSINGLGHNNRMVSNYQKAIDCFSTYLDISQKIKDHYGISAALSNLSHCYIETGDFKKAEEMGEQSLRISGEKKIWFPYCYGNTHYGYLMLEEENFSQAINYLETARDVFEHQTLLKDYTIYLYPLLAESYLEKFKLIRNDIGKKEKKEEINKIKKACYKALKLTKSWNNYHTLSLRVIAKYKLMIGKKQSAYNFFQKSILLATSLNRRYEMAKSCYELALFFKETENDTEFKNHLQKACDLFKEIGAKEYINRCMKLLGHKVKDIEQEEESPQDRFKIERRMTTVLDTSRYLSSILNLDELLERIMDKTIELVGAQRGILLLYPEMKGLKKKLEVRVIRNVERNDIKGPAFETSQSIIERVEKEKKPLIVEDATTDAQLKKAASVVRYGLKSILCAPIMARGVLIGVIYLDNHLVSGLFSQEDLMVLDLISGQAGVSIENARLYNRAVTDGLTGLYNRIFFENYLMKSVSEAQRYKKSLSLVMIDIDHFKTFNDKYGHQAGDLVIISVAGVISENTRNSDIAARYGGDEFVIIMPETTLEEAKDLSKKIWEIVGKNKLLYRMGTKPSELSVSLSIGVTEYGENEDRLEFLEKADKALYRAKEKGRNRIETSYSGRTTRIIKVRDKRTRLTKLKSKKGRS